MALLAAIPEAGAFPVHGKQTVLPVGTELNEDAVGPAPRKSSARRRSAAPNPIWSISAIWRSVRRRSWAAWRGRPASAAAPAMSMAPPIQNSTSPALSTGAREPLIRASSLFNAKADNHVLDPVTVPSLRGDRYLAPYGHDGRICLAARLSSAMSSSTSSPAPNPRRRCSTRWSSISRTSIFCLIRCCGPGGRLTAQASAAARRGEALVRQAVPA